MKIKTKLISNFGDNYLICDLRMPYAATELQNIILQYKGIHLVFLHSICHCDAMIRSYEFGFDHISISAGALLCTAKYLFDICSAGTVHIITADAIKCPVMVKEKRITAELPLPAYDRDDFVLYKEIKYDGKRFYMAEVVIGYPHAVLFCEDIQTFPFARTAAELRNLGLISHDVNFVAAQVTDPARVIIRTYYNQFRELSASGNAAVAAAIAAVQNDMINRTVHVQCSDGCYTVYIPSENQPVQITGEAKVIERAI